VVAGGAVSARARARANAAGSSSGCWSRIAVMVTAVRAGSGADGVVTIWGALLWQPAIATRPSASRARSGLVPPVRVALSLSGARAPARR
jgi:hypothetical protein